MYYLQSSYQLSLLLSQYVTGEIELQKMYKMLYLQQSVQAEICKCTVGDYLCCPILPYTDKVVLPLTVMEAKSRPYHFSHADECNVYWKPISIIHVLVYLSSELLSYSLLFSLCSYEIHFSLDLYWHRHQSIDP